MRSGKHSPGKEDVMRINRMASVVLPSALLFALSAPAVSMAQTATSDDKAFVKDAIEGGNAEVELGQLAEQRAVNDDVKAFGKKMVDDHTQLGEQMKTVAGQIGVTPPKMIPPMDKALEVTLKMLSGDDFDQAYIKAMVKDHEQDLAAFKKETAQGSSPAAKSAAEQGEQVISSHLVMIRQLAQAHNINTAGL
jgi:putative membrane protein